MLILIAVLALGALLFSRIPRLEGSPDARTRMETAKPAVRAYVDGKPVKSYVKE